MPFNDKEIKRIHFQNEAIIPQIIALLDSGHTVTLMLRGISMRPFLEDNRDKALLKKAENVNVGDVVLAEISPKRYVLHRLTEIEGDRVVLMGDGNLGTEQCRMSDIHGYAIGFYRKGRSKIECTDSVKWKTYSFLWMHLRPIRRYLLFLYRITLKSAKKK